MSLWCVSMRRTFVIRWMHNWPTRIQMLNIYMHAPLYGKIKKDTFYRRFHAHRPQWIYQAPFSMSTVDFSLTATCMYKYFNATDVFALTFQICKSYKYSCRTCSSVIAILSYKQHLGYFKVLLNKFVKYSDYPTASWEWFACQIYLDAVRTLIATLNSFIKHNTY